MNLSSLMVSTRIRSVCERRRSTETAAESRRPSPRRAARAASAMASSAARSVEKPLSTSILDLESMKPSTLSSSERSSWCSSSVHGPLFSAPPPPGASAPSAPEELARGE